jgi:Lon protease-like protein
MTDDTEALAQFRGVARLFPLPNLAFFPHVLQPLHIFEPRYRQMTADALADDRLIALVMLAGDWEKDYQGRPAIHPVGCLGTIVADQRLDDGRYNLLLRGVSRVRVVRELPADKLYRQAEVALVEDVEPAPEVRRSFRQLLVDTVSAWLPDHSGIHGELAKLLQSSLPLGALTDILTFALPLPPEVKQQQLEDPLVDVRVQRLVEHLPVKEAAASQAAAHPAGEEPAGEEPRKFPPDFSTN